MLDRAYSTFSVKSVDDDERIIEGYASTPDTDRTGDVMDPFGAEFSLPHPLLWQHRHDEPIGHVIAANVTDKGIQIRARLAPKGTLARIDEIWALIKHGLVGGMSIGFRGQEAAPIKGSLGTHFKRWLWLETSAVTIPANQHATIHLVKSLDTGLVASDMPLVVEAVKPAGVTAPVVRVLKGTPRAMTYQEAVKTLEASIAAKSAELETIQAKVREENRTKDAAERETFDTVKDEIKSLMAELADARDLEALNVTKAVPVTGKTPEEGTRSRTSEPSRVVEFKSLPLGTGFTRYAMAVAAGKGSLSDTLAYAKRWDGQTPEVSAYIKAIAGTIGGGSPSWGGELQTNMNLASEFVQLLFPRLVINNIPGIRRVPFDVDITVQTGGSTVNWVGEAAAKPVGELDFTTITLGHNKIAGIVVLSDELVRSSQPNAEEVVRRDLVDQVSKFMNQQFLDPTVTATSSRPASITNGVSAPNASGTDADALYVDLNGALATYDTAETGTENVVLVMPPALARGISALRNALGQFEFPGLNVGGGTVMGYPVIVSSSVPSGTIVIIKGDEILMADDGQTTLDASNQATLDMAGGNTPTFNLWQKNCVGIRAERWVTWAKRRATAVAMIDTAAYAPS